MKLTTLIATAGIAILSGCAIAQTNSPDRLNDLEIAHVAYTADNIDIRYAHLALALSDNPAIHKFAATMIRDHTAVNEQALALLGKLKAQPQDNFLSRQLVVNSKALVEEMSKLQGAAFDRRYAENELAYHRAVNDLVANAFIPNIENGEVKTLFAADSKSSRCTSSTRQ
jgi:putative membrane protein